jgi:hypothetical protein
MHWNWACVALILSGLALAQPLPGQSASADSAAIVALELEMSRLLMGGRIDEYATHLTADYARATRQGKLERRDAALIWERRHTDHQDLRASAGTLAAGRAPRFRHPPAVTQEAA